MGDELYCDGGIVATNPAAVAIHEARSVFPEIPIDMIVSCGTGGKNNMFLNLELLPGFMNKSYLK